MPETVVNGGINWSLVLPVIIVVLIVVLVISIIGKLFKVAIVLGALVIVVPILIAIMWGDGTSYVEKFASLFSPDIRTQIEQGYEYYKEKDNENPVINVDKVTEVTTDIFDSAKDVATDIFDRVKDVLETPSPSPSPSPSPTQ